jgi:fructose-specific phosphotransferase system IIC component
MDNKISFLAGYILTAASAISAAGFLNAIILGLLGGFFGLLGKEAYYHLRDEVKAKAPSVKAWIAKKTAWIKSKI